MGSAGLEWIVGSQSLVFRQDESEFEDKTLVLLRIEFQIKLIGLKDLLPILVIRSGGPEIDVVPHSDPGPLGRG